MKKKIGIIGSTGRMGHLLSEKIEKHPHFVNGPGFSRSSQKEISLGTVFSDSDYVIDFSNPELLSDILENALKTPKPLLICSTGWDEEQHQRGIEEVSKKAPLIIASNTSVGANLQRLLVGQLAKILGLEYDIDLIEKHHRNKIDTPSGTAASLIQEIRHAKEIHQDLKYEASFLTQKGPRPEQFIGVSVQRSGNIAGDHEVTFTSLEEMISVRHVAFDRGLFAQGALRAVEWLEQSRPKPGLYTMSDVLGFCYS